MIERGQRLQAEVAVEIEAAEAELASAVAAPVEGDVDPTGWLPTELMILVLSNVVDLGVQAVAHAVSGPSAEGCVWVVAVAGVHTRHRVTANDVRTRWLGLGVGCGEAREGVLWVGGQDRESVVWIDRTAAADVARPYIHGVCSCDRTRGNRVFWII